MTVSEFNRRLTALATTATKLANKNTHGMGNVEHAAVHLKIRKNEEATRTLIMSVDVDVYDASVAPSLLCADYSDWVYPEGE